VWEKIGIIVESADTREHTNKTADFIVDFLGQLKMMQAPYTCKRASSGSSTSLLSPQLPLLDKHKKQLPSKAFSDEQSICNCSRMIGHSIYCQHSGEAFSISLALSFTLIAQCNCGCGACAS
jgi:hypothetical protein